MHSMASASLPRTCSPHSRPQSPRLPLLPRIPRVPDCTEGGAPRPTTAAGSAGSAFPEEASRHWHAGMTLVRQPQLNPAGPAVPSPGRHRQTRQTSRWQAPAKSAILPSRLRMHPPRPDLRTQATRRSRP